MAACCCPARVLLASHSCVPDLSRAVVPGLALFTAACREPICHIRCHTNEQEADKGGTLGPSLAISYIRLEELPRFCPKSMGKSSISLTRREWRWNVLKEMDSVTSPGIHRAIGWGGFNQVACLPFPDSHLPGCPAFLWSLNTELGNPFLKKKLGMEYEKHMQN